MFRGDEAFQVDHVVRPLDYGLGILLWRQYGHLGRRIRYVFAVVVVVVGILAKF